MRNKTPIPPNEKKLRRKLTELTEQVRGFISMLDRVMVEPSSAERGRKVAELCNRLALYNDGVRFFWCNVEYRKDTPWTGSLAEPFKASAPPSKGATT